MLEQNIVNHLPLSSVAVKKKAPSKKLKSRWQCKVPELLLDEYRVVPLISAKMMRSEGYLMNNCCKEYITPCAQGEYAVFSIRSWKGDRVATLGMKCVEGYWYFDQCYGPSNSNVMERWTQYVDEEGLEQHEQENSELFYVAHEVVRQMNCAEMLSHADGSVDSIH